LHARMNSSERSNQMAHAPPQTSPPPTIRPIPG